MKPILLFLLLFAGSGALAQSSSSLNTVINEDGKILSILVDGDRNGRTIKYDRKFDVARMNSSEKEALKSRVLDSLGIGDSALGPEATAPRNRTTAAGGVGTSVPAKPTGIESSRTPQPPVPTGSSADAGQTMVTFTCESCAGKVKLMLASATEDYSVERDAKAGTDKRLFPYKLQLSAGEYQLTYYQNGVLQIQSTFTVRTGGTNTIAIK